MRNDFKPMRNASFLRINDRNSMRNTILYPILLYYWFTYNYRIIYENMRNENEKSFAGAHWCKCRKLSYQCFSRKW